MKRQRGKRSVRLAALVFALVWCAPLAPGQPGAPHKESTDRSSEIRFYDHVKPILAVHCYKCHGGEERKGGLKLDTLEGALAGGKSGEAAVQPGHSSRSALVRRITSSDPEEQMPPKGPRLTAEEVARISQWIEAGAPWPERDDYWAFQPLRPGVVPPAAQQGIRNPIDHFITSRLKVAGIRPRPEAALRTLLRRAYADLLGVPPTPEEAEQFLSDGRPDAFERLVDRLLADPRYGERWARHWLDLARYGESDGYEDDKIRPHAWRYRDYVIRAFNHDKPYARFVQEQIAGDELWPDESDAWIATGFARLGPWDGMSKEPQKQRQDFLNDVTDAVGAVFLGVTIGCARCHDHKYDEITQADYYGVQAFFAGVKRELREMKVALPEPPEITAAHARDSGALKALKEEREELWRAAREALERERSAAGAANSAKEQKTSDADVSKRVDHDHPGRRAKLDAAIKELDARVRLFAPKVEAVFVSGDSRPVTRLLFGGELNRPGPEITPGFVQAMVSAGATATCSETEPSENHRRAPMRRADLARWLTSPAHPLTARVMVNRLWQHHFGAGLVRTASDFGRNGDLPTHPELLDWLAGQFIQEGWGLKRMHRLLMTSAAYRRSSASEAAALKIDPDNRLLWRMNRRRLESEAIRDTFLAVGGALNTAMGGPGVYAKLPKGINIEFPNNDKELSWGASTPADDRRRSIYLFQRRTLTYPLMEIFDAAPMNQSCAIRPQTTVAPQTLALFNGEFARETAADFAARLQREASADRAARIERAFHVALARPPSAQERHLAQQFLAEQAQRRKESSEPERAALIDFCHVLLNANELIYLD